MRRSLRSRTLRSPVLSWVLHLPLPRLTPLFGRRSSWTSKSFTPLVSDTFGCVSCLNELPQRVVKYFRSKRTQEVHRIGAV